MIEYASAAIETIKVAIDLTKGATALKNETDVNAAVLQIQRTLMDAQQQILDGMDASRQLRMKVEELERKLAQQDEWRDEASRYELTAHESGAYTYVLRSNEEGVSHQLCSNCFTKKHKSILNVSTWQTGSVYAHCAACGAHITLREGRPPNMIPSTSRFV